MLILETGDEIPADAYVVAAFDLKVDESSATGEADGVAKSSLATCLAQKAARLSALDGHRDRHRLVDSPVLLSGTTALQGSATAVVAAVGKHSQVGQVMQQLNIETEPTPLQAKLNGLARDIGKAGFIAAAVTFGVLLTQYWIIWILTKAADRDDLFEIAKTTVRFLVEAITLIVVAVPEGLPLAVTLSLAYSVGRMLLDQNYVRRLAACETMGGANEICSDKTGTLTRNRMEVQALWNGSNLDMELNFRVPNFMPPLPWIHWQALVEGIVINSTAYLEAAPEGGDPKPVGSATEAALLMMLHHVGIDWASLRHASNEEGIVVYRDPFSSVRKMMTTVTARRGSGLRVHVKGAAESVLQLCDSRVTSAGTLKSMDQEYRERLERTVIRKMVGECLRAVCIAYRDLGPDEDLEDLDEAVNVGGGGREFVAKSFETELTCLAIVGIRDPVRTEVPAAVIKCQQAGITVRMVTGDNLDTAKQIARQCNIYHPEEGGIAMLGSEFHELVGGVVCSRCEAAVCNCVRGPDDPAPRIDVIENMRLFRDIVPQLQVLARSQPRDKYALVTGLRQMGAVVAVTGDGANDAPALKKADVGFAMGICGKELAKQAADIVLLDDNFESIVKAVLWGRNIFDNVRRFLQFQLTVNLSAVTTALIGSTFLRSSPLCAVQLLWVNLIMDSFASLALATEPPSQDLLKRPPHSRQDYLVSKVMWRSILCQSVYQVLVMLLVTFTGDCWLPEFDADIPAEFAARNPDFSQYSARCGGGRTVRSGRPHFLFSDEEDYKENWMLEFGASRHYTYIFNIFVWMQIFNMFNARCLEPSSFNVFKGITRSRMFCLILSCVVLGQIALVTFGGFAVEVHPNGLTWQQWLICVALGAGSLLVGVASHLLPLRVLPESGRRETQPLGVRRTARRGGPPRRTIFPTRPHHPELPRKPLSRDDLGRSPVATERLPLRHLQSVPVSVHRQLLEPQESADLLDELDEL
eukprot:Polyplicarium_translucidae@DN1194_c0_g1_i1.p1